MSGAEEREVQLFPYDPAWARKYEDEAWRLRQAVGPLVRDVQHIGSTAVAGLAAEPIVDIAVAVDDIGIVNVLKGPLSTLGYEYEGMLNGVEGHHVFRKGDPCEFSLHVVEEGSERWARCVAFRDYLAANPAAAADYGVLKKELAARFVDDRQSYMQGKEAFIAHTTESATEEGQESPDDASGRVTSGKESADPIGKPAGLERFNSLMVGVFLLALSISMTCAAVFTPIRPASIADYFPCMFMLGILWAITAGVFLLRSRKSRLQRGSDWCIAGVFGVMVFCLLIVSIKEALTPDSPARAVYAGAALLLAIILRMGLPVFLPSRRKTRKRDRP